MRGEHKLFVLGVNVRDVCWLLCSGEGLQWGMKLWEIDAAVSPPFGNVLGSPYDVLCAAMRGRLEDGQAVFQIVV